MSDEEEKERSVFRVRFCSSRLNGDLMSAGAKPGRWVRRKSELLPYEAGSVRGRGFHSRSCDVG